MFGSGAYSNTVVGGAYSNVMSGAAFSTFQAVAAPPPPAWTWNTEHPDSYANTILLHHHEDNAANTVVVDSSGNGFNSTATANTNGIYTIGGRFNGGFYANDLFYATNVGAAFRLAIQAALASRVTIEFWIKNDSLDWSTQGDQYEGMYFCTVANMINSFAYVSGINTIYFQYIAGGVTKNITDIIIVDTNTWHHIASTIDVPADEYKVYIDGAQIGLTQNGLGVWAGVNGTLYIPNDQTLGRTFDGVVDEFAASNVIRY